jgi:carboxylate-amine ligase
VDFPDLVDELIEILSPDAAELGCSKELEGIRGILERGTSAHRQLAVYESALAEGHERQEALRAVVDMLMSETVADLGDEPQPGRTNANS